MNARERAEQRGWVFRPLNPMPELVLRAQHTHAFDRLAPAVEQRNTPLTDAQRTWNYIRQMGVRRPLTPAQQRRRAHKAHVSRVELAQLAGTR